MQGCYQKVHVSVPAAAFLRVLRLFSERDQSYSFQEQLPDWVLAVGDATLQPKMGCLEDKAKESALAWSLFEGSS